MCVPSPCRSFCSTFATDQVHEDDWLRCTFRLSLYDEADFRLSVVLICQAGHIPPRDFVKLVRTTIITAFLHYFRDKDDSL
jgi:hypothetical protein